MKLHYFPRSSYSQKTLIAFHEKAVPFTPVLVDLTDAASRAEHAKLSPLGKVPVLVLDNGWKIPESSIIIEYLDTHFSTGTRLIPEDRDLARQTRFHDRLADLYVNDPMVEILTDARKPPEQRDAARVAAARARIDTMYAGFDQHLGGGNRTWLMGDAFTMADCALIPSLGYLRTVHPFDRWKNLSAYANRAFERPSFQKVAAEVAAFTSSRSM